MVLLRVSRPSRVFPAPSALHALSSSRKPLLLALICRFCPALSWRFLRTFPQFSRASPLPRFPPQVTRTLPAVCPHVDRGFPVSNPHYYRAFPVNYPNLPGDFNCTVPALLPRSPRAYLALHLHFPTLGNDGIKWGQFSRTKCLKSKLQI